MPGGQGSVAPSYEMPSGNYTFYYMELALEGKLTRKVQQFKVQFLMYFQFLPKNLDKIFSGEKEMFFIPIPIIEFLT